MRHYMVDPDNEERLLKIPPRVVKAIQGSAFPEGVKQGRQEAMRAVLELKAWEDQHGYAVVKQEDAATAALGH